MKIATSRERIAELIQISGDNQSEMANKAGINRSAICRYLAGTQEPNQKSIDKIATAYRVSPAWLMGYDVSMETKSDKSILKMLNMLTDKDKDFIIKTIEYLAERS